MSNFSIKIDLLKLAGAKVVSVKGERAILIPTDSNREIFIGEKGAYLDLTAIALKEESKFGDTHFVKGNLPRDVFNSMTEEQRRAVPILGNLKPLGAQNAQASVPAEEVEVEDDLPF